MVADAHVHPRDTRVPLPHPHEERSVKEICRTIREKSQGDGWGGVCGGGGGGALDMFFSRVGLRMADLNFNHGPRCCDPGRALATQFGTDI